MNCQQENTSTYIWLLVILICLILGIIAYISSKIRAYRQRKQREKSLPFVEDNISQGASYNVFLCDGKKYLSVHIVGTSDTSTGQFSIGGWEGMLVLMQSSGKRVFIKQSSVRCIEEA